MSWDRPVSPWPANPQERRGGNGPTRKADQHRIHPNKYFGENPITKSRPSSAHVLDLLAAVRRVLGPDITIDPGLSISTTQFLALRTLAVVDRTSSEAALSLGVRLPTMTQLADGLVARGWVERRDDPEDRRRVRLALTRDGKEVYRSARERAEEHMQHILDRLSPGEGRALVDGLQALRAAFIATQTVPSEPAKAHRAVGGSLGTAR